MKMICAFILSLSTVAAYANQDNILCPSVDILQASVNKLDTSQKINDQYYIAYTATSFLLENNIWWFAGVGNIVATSNHEAITIGKKILTNVNIKIDIYATKVGNEFICNYAPGYIQARGKYLV